MLANECLAIANVLNNLELRCCGHCSWLGSNPLTFTIFFHSNLVNILTPVSTFTPLNQVINGVGPEGGGNSNVACWHGELVVLNGDRIAFGIGHCVANEYTVLIGIVGQCHNLAHMSSSLVGSDSTILALSDGDGVVNSSEGSIDFHIEIWHHEACAFNDNFFSAIHVVNLTNCIASSRSNCEVNNCSFYSTCWGCFNSTILKLSNSNIVRSFYNIEVCCNSSCVLAFTGNSNGSLTNSSVVAVLHSVITLAECCIACFNNYSRSNSLASIGLVGNCINRGDSSTLLELGANLCSVRRLRHRKSVHIFLVYTVDGVSLNINKAAHGGALGLYTWCLSLTTTNSFLYGDVAALNVVAGFRLDSYSHCLARNSFCLVGSDGAIDNAGINRHWGLNTHAHFVLVATGIEHNLVGACYLDLKILVGIS